MLAFDQLILEARQGRVVHLSRPSEFSPLFDLLNASFARLLNSTEPLAKLFSKLSATEYQNALDGVVCEMDNSLGHYKLMAQCLATSGISEEEAFLVITLDKSLRTALSGRYKKNYGYHIHRDSWFDLSPDGVNVVLYLTDVPYEGNTIFFRDWFQRDIPYDSAKRCLIGMEPEDLGEISCFNCRANDVLIFAGDQLHGGPRMEIDRLSIEFRVSRMWDYGRPQQNIYYSPVREFLKEESGRSPADLGRSECPGVPVR